MMKSAIWGRKGPKDEECSGVALYTESDPHGKTPHEPGAKLDAGKLDMWLMVTGFQKPLADLTEMAVETSTDFTLPRAVEALSLWPLALSEVAKVTNAGAVKYTSNGWKTVPNAVPRYSAAMCRHARDLTEEIDDDTGCLHMAQVIWNALAAASLTDDTEEYATYLQVAFHFLMDLERGLVYEEGTQEQ